MIQTNPPPATVEGAPVKPGRKTTEFWGKLLVQIIVLLNSKYDVAIEMDHETAIIIVSALEALYMLIRGHIKASSYRTVTIVENKP